jgi:hypothetical protein
LPTEAFVRDPRGPLSLESLERVQPPSKGLPVDAELDGEVGLMLARLGGGGSGFSSRRFPMDGESGGRKPYPSHTRKELGCLSR